MMREMKVSLLLMLIASSLITYTDAAAGVNYGTDANNLPPATRAVELIKSSRAGFDRVKIFTDQQDIISAVAKAGGLKLAIAVPNDQLSSFAGGNTALDWVRTKVAPSASTINLVIVGNEVDRGGDWNNLLPAMRKVQEALQQNGLASGIRVTTPFSAGVLQKSDPPSAGIFDPKVLPVLDFLERSGAPLMVNVYPYFAWRGNKGSISLDYALFRSSNAVVKDGGYEYTNLFDAIVDAGVAALERAGHGKMELVVGESGWPNADGDGASVENAQQYNSGLLQKLRSNKGTPRRPGALTAYIFALFNENLKNPGTEQHWGLYDSNGNPVYSLNL